MKNKEQIFNLFSKDCREQLIKAGLTELNEVEEIRLRVTKPLIVHFRGEDFYIDKVIGMTKNKTNHLMIVHRKDILQTVERLSNYSLYAYEEELSNGYITIEGGHRVGVVGKAVLNKGAIRTLRDISGINIRIAHEIIGSANKVMPFIVSDKEIKHTLIISPPKCGKTTILRDIIRQLSDGNRFMGQGINVGVVDERSEIAACYQGMPQNKVGDKTDVLDGCPKAQGMMMLLRSMAPKVIVVDEIGAVEDIAAIEYILNAGVKIICTVHGKDFDDLKCKPVLNELITKKIFQRFVVLSANKRPGTIEQVLDDEGGEI